MDGPSVKKSTSLETLVIQNIANVTDLKSKLNDIINTGKEYNYDVSSCIKYLLKSTDQEIVLLSIKAISELAKCEEKRETYAQRDIIEPLVTILHKELCSESTEIIKQCCRALGNLCCDCDASRKIILDCNGIPALIGLLAKSLEESKQFPLDELKKFSSKTLLNFAIGGQDFSEAIVQGGVIELLYKTLMLELEKDDMNDDTVSTALLILSVINDNNSEILFEPEVNLAVLNVLKETANIDVSELCLEHLNAQAEHDSVKTLLANEEGIHLVCIRLEQLVQRQEAGDLHADDSEVDAVVKLACDLIVIVLTGDEAMNHLYANGAGFVYTRCLSWLRSAETTEPSGRKRAGGLVAAGVLAAGNFARGDVQCAQMMADGCFDTLLDIFEAHQNAEAPTQPGQLSLSTRLQHGALSALRNLAVPKENKKIAAKNGRAATLLIKALPNVEDPNVAYKLLATIRMLVDGQAPVAHQLVTSPEALSAVCRWGGAGGGGAGAEGGRLLAWALRERPPHAPVLREEGCVSCLVNMLISCHTMMQNEAILGLTLLAVDCLRKHTDDQEFDPEPVFVAQLKQSEIGKHICVLIETNCAKMPTEIAENLLAFLEITCSKRVLTEDYVESKVLDALQKYVDARQEFSDVLKKRIANVITAIADCGKNE